MIYKVCSACKINKEGIEFSKSKKGLHKLGAWCKSCRLDYNRKNKDHINTLRRSRRKDSAYKIKALEYSRIWSIKNPEKLKAKRNRCKLQNRIRSLKYYHENKQKIIPIKVQKNKIHRNSSPIHNLKSRLRSRLKGVLKGKYKKSSRTMEILGCSIEYFKAHLESLFQPGMTWENRRLWHIDHIIPLSSGKNEMDLYRLCHYTNLQPLWATDNLKKGSKVILNEIR